MRNKIPVHEREPSDDSRPSMVTRPAVWRTFSFQVSLAYVAKFRNQMLCLRFLLADGS